MFDYCTSIIMSGDNWEGDKDLDSFKGQDWKDGVIRLYKTQYHIHYL